MKKTVLIIALLFITSALSAQSVRYQKGYYRSDGTYVKGHYKTRKNNTTRDNYSTTGNYNPYTNKKGYRANDYSNDAAHYGSGRTIYTGPKGGQYYIVDKAICAEIE